MYVYIMLFQGGNFATGKINKALLANFDDMLRIGKDRSSQVMDARKLENFIGEGEEPAKREWHIFLVQY